MNESWSLRVLKDRFKLLVKQDMVPLNLCFWLFMVSRLSAIDEKLQVKSLSLTAGPNEFSRLGN